MRTCALTILAIAMVNFLPAGVSTAMAEDAPRPQECDHGMDVTIEGVLHRTKEYGAPGWGEDPAHDEPWTMITIHPAATSQGALNGLFKRCGEDEAEASVVQLWLDKHAFGQARDGQQVTVKGKLRFADGSPQEIRIGQVDVSTITSR